MCTDCRRGPKAGGHAIHPFAVGALTFLKGGHASAGILVDGVEALPDEVPIGVDHPNGDIGECTHFHTSKFASTALTYDTHCHSHITVSVLSQLCMFKSPRRR